MQNPNYKTCSKYNAIPKRIDLFPVKFLQNWHEIHALIVAKSKAEEWGTDRPVAVVEEAVEAADPVAGPEQPLLAAGIPATEPGRGAEGEPAEERREGRLEEHGLGLGEAADGVHREHRLQEVEAVVPRRAHGAHLPVSPPAARHRGAARAAVAAEVVVVPRIAGAEGAVVREHAHRRAGRHGCG